MKLMVQSWDSTGPSYNVEAEEAAFLDYSFLHATDGAAEFSIILSDPTGSIFQKYKGVAAAVYCGPGKVTIEDPTGTDFFYGRILRAVPNTSSRTVTLFCQDWLSQLDDEQIDYDMREDLDGSGLRESQLHADVDGTFVAPAQVGIKYAILDDGGAFTDYTTEANEYTEDDVILHPALPALNDAFYFGFAEKVDGFSLYLSQQGDFLGTTTWEYWDGDSWEELTDGPTAPKSNFEQAEGLTEYTWTTQVDWATTTIDGNTAYWVRARISTFVNSTAIPKARNIGAEYFIYDDDMAWANDAWNGYYFILPQTMTGRQTISTGPYALDGILGGGGTIDTENGAFDDVWDDDANFWQIIENDEDIDRVLTCRLWGNISSLYVASSIRAMRVVLVYDNDSPRGSFVGLRDPLPGGLYKLPFLAIDGDKLKQTFTLPVENISDVINSEGETQVYVHLEVTPATTSNIKMYQISVEIDVDITGYSTLVTIMDTITTNKLRLNKNMHPIEGLGPVGLWEGCQYSIAQEIFEHIASDGNRGTLITDGDDMETLTCLSGVTIENTSGVSTRQYIAKTRLQILQDLRLQDKAHFWIPLASTTVTWKSTFGAATETLTDTDVLEWTGTLDALAVANKYIVQGARIGDSQLESTYTDTDSETYYNMTRTKSVKEPGLTSEYDTLARATALTNQYKDAHILLSAMIDGNTVKATHDKTIIVGDIIEITSTYLGLSGVVYVVQRQEYDTPNDQTKLTLHPRASLVGMQELERKGTQSLTSTVRRGTVDNFVAGNASDTL